MSSFFTIPGDQKKRKRPAASEGPKKRLATTKAPGKSAAKPAPASKKRAERDDSISGSDSEDEDEFEGVSAEDGSDESGDEKETAAERRLRLAQSYLDNVKQEVDEYGFDAEDIDRDIIAERLQEDLAEAKGKVYRDLAAELAVDQASSCTFKWNAENVNGVATCSPYAYTVSRDMFLSKWRIQDLPQNQWPQTTKKKPKKPHAPPKRQPERVKYWRGDANKAKDKNYKGHTDAILCVAASPDGQYVVTGGEDSKLIVYNAETLKPIRAFTHHRDAVTGIAFRRGTNQFYSCSKDRTVKSWTIDEGNPIYVETLFGHQDIISSIDALSAERCLTSGSRDRTARIWKIVEESQLVFRGNASVKRAPEGVDPKSMAAEGSMDRVAMLDDELFVTGSDNGSIALWSTAKKKPLSIVVQAHGLEPHLAPKEASSEKNPDPSVIPPPQPRWITALRAIPYTNVVLSGSWDGHVRVWRLSEDKKKLLSLGILGGQTKEVVTNGDHAGDKAPKAPTPAGAKLIKGVVNDISLFERGDKGKDGLCVIAAVGKDHRFGRWRKLAGARNGAMVFEVPRVTKEVTNGAQESSEDEDA